MRIILLVIICISALGCKKDGPDAITTLPPSPSHPTITWTADTIRYPGGEGQLSLYSLWGSDTNDVYAIGHGSNGGTASLYHYNGQNWTIVKVSTLEGGFVDSYVSLLKIAGSEKNDVWAVGRRGELGSPVDSSLVIHYDGSTWSEVKMPKCEGNIAGVRVMSRTNVYLTGSHGEVYHFDGTTYSKTILDSNLVLTIGGDENRLVIGGRTFNLLPQDYYCVYEKNNMSNWDLLIKATDEVYHTKPRFGISDFYSLGDGRVFSVGYGIYMLTGTNWTTSLYDDYPYYQIKGTASNNVFAISPFNMLKHWNGVDWKDVNVPVGLSSNGQFAALWVKDNKLFLAYLYQFSANIIYRGTYSN